MIGKLLNCAYFALSLAAFSWLLANYFTVSLIIVPLLGLTTGYLIATAFSIIELSRATAAVSPDTAASLSIPVKKLIRAAALLIPLPAVLFCFSIYLCALTYDKSPAAFERVTTIVSIESAVFGKSFLWNHLFANQKIASMRIDDLEVYINGLYANLPEEAFSTDSRTGAEVAVTLRVNRDGSTSDVKITQSSGRSDLDNAAQKTVAALPFKALPSGTCDYSDFTFRFDGKQLASVEEQESAPDPNCSVGAMSFFATPAVNH